MVHPGGRPSIFTPELAERICTEVITGKSLRKIEALSGMPSRETILTWAATNREFSDQYVRALQIRGFAAGDEVIDIADDATNDFSTDEDGNPVVNHENIQRSKLRVDARKWFASKLAPKLYGDRLMVDTNQQTTINVLNMPPDQARELLKRRGAVVLPEERGRLLAAPGESEAVEVEVKQEPEVCEKPHNQPKKRAK